MQNSYIFWRRVRCAYEYPSPLPIQVGKKPVHSIHGFAYSRAPKRIVGCTVVDRRADAERDLRGRPRVSAARRRDVTGASGAPPDAAHRLLSFGRADNRRLRRADNQNVSAMPASIRQLSYNDRQCRQ